MIINSARKRTATWLDRFYQPQREKTHAPLQATEKHQSISYTADFGLIEERRLQD
ncbi:hypothetical protein V8G57_18075 [Collimonas sp. H4R21]|jgi:hypothetical protein|uniref:Uncharacterized protein n=1 Tax=Collimonas rhizosphaerae TaxID=3126357 RepID=A0ABU9PZ66_9BURK